MKFLIGLLAGLGIGFAVAILFAPEKRKESPLPWLRERAEGEGGASGNNHASDSGLRSLMDTVKQRVNEALDEAKEASREAEKEMQARYERMVGKETERK
jgi:gas vesicle protein